MMSPYELSILVYEATAAIDSIFETWMAATFALIVASHVADDKMTISTKLFVAILYFACAALLFFRYINFAQQTFQYLSELAKYDVNRIVNSDAQYIGLARRLVMIIGTVGSIIFLFVATKKSDANISQRDT